MQITQVPADPRNYGQRGGTRVSLVVIHIMEGYFVGTGAWFHNPAAHDSAHYGISVDGLVAQYVPERCEAWHAGNATYNARSIGIELEGHADDPDAFTDSMMESLAELCTDIRDRHGLFFDRQHFIGHNEVPDPRHAGQFGGVSHHPCPGKFFPWTKFIARLVGGPEVEWI